MDLIEEFTSTGAKLLTYPIEMYRLQNDKKPQPMNLQICPTNKCNIDCSFCSVGKRDKNLELNVFDILKLVDDLIKHGSLKAVELTGGGEPTVYPYINELIAELHKRKLSIGLITNGYETAKLINTESQRMLTWVRISANTLEKYNKLSIPHHVRTIGFSYVLTTTDYESWQFLKKLYELSKKVKASYIRVVVNCLKKDYVGTALITEIKNNPLMFFQDKTPKKPKECYFGYIKPFLYPNEYVYPCNALSLAPKADRDFPEKLAMFHMNDVGSWLEKDISKGCIYTDNEFCNSCRFHKQNELLGLIINKRIKHREHI